MQRPELTWFSDQDKGLRSTGMAQYLSTRSIIRIAFFVLSASCPVLSCRAFQDRIEKEIGPALSLVGSKRLDRTGRDRTEKIVLWSSLQQTYTWKYFSKMRLNNALTRTKTCRSQLSLSTVYGTDAHCRRTGHIIRGENRYCRNPFSIVFDSKRYRNVERFDERHDLRFSILN